MILIWVWINWEVWSQHLRQPVGMGWKTSFLQASVMNPNRNGASLLTWEKAFRSWTHIFSVFFLLFYLLSHNKHNQFTTNLQPTYNHCTINVQSICNQFTLNASINPLVFLTPLSLVTQQTQPIYHTMYKLCVYNHMFKFTLNLQPQFTTTIYNQSTINLHSMHPSIHIVYQHPRIVQVGREWQVDWFDSSKSQGRKSNRKMEKSSPWGSSQVSPGRNAGRGKEGYRPSWWCGWGGNVDIEWDENSSRRRYTQLWTGSELCFWFSLTTYPNRRFLHNFRHFHNFHNFFIHVHFFSS